MGIVFTHLLRPETLHVVSFINLLTPRQLFVQVPLRVHLSIFGGIIMLSDTDVPIVIIAASYFLGSE